MEKRSGERRLVGWERQVVQLGGTDLSVQVAASAVKVGMNKIDGNWLISSFDPV